MSQGFGVGLNPLLACGVREAARGGRRGNYGTRAATARLATRFEPKATGDPTMDTWGLGEMVAHGVGAYLLKGQRMRTGSALFVDIEEGRSLVEIVKVRDHRLPACQLPMDLRECRA